MIDYSSTFENYLDKIRQENRYREFIGIERQAGNFPHALYKYGNETTKVVMWCINDYLGMSQHEQVLEAAKLALKNCGVGSGGTRNIGGNNLSLLELEQELTSLHKKEATLIFTSGYVANDTTLTSLVKIMPDLIFFSDEANHASIIAGIRNSRAEKFIYRHIDPEHLEQLLAGVEISRPKIIVFESTYSMNGLISPVEKIIKLAKKYNALTFIDEVHSVGLYGNEGAGIAEQLGLASEIDIIQGTLAKAYGTIGGYITSSNQFIEAIRLSAPGFIFTTSLPPVIAKAATASIKYLRKSDKERIIHQQVVGKVKQALDDAQIQYFKNDSHIIPIIIGDPIKAKQASHLLLTKHKIYVQHINFPTVPKGTERLRIIPTPGHSDQMIQDLILALIKVFEELDIQYQKLVA